MEKTDQELLEEAFEEALAEEEDKATPRSDDIVVDDDTDEDKAAETQTEEKTDKVPQDDSDGIFNRVPAAEGAPANKDGDKPKDDAETDYKALYEKEVQRNKSWEGRIRAANKRAEDAEAALKEAQAKQDKPKVLPEGEDDEEILNTFMEEFPELEKPLKVLIHKEAKAIAAKEVETIRPTVDDLKAQTQQTTADTHFKMIDDAHPGWRQIVDSGDLLKWIEAQPAFLQQPLKDVYEKGSAQEVIEMLHSYKKSAAPKPNPKKEDADPPNKKAEKLMAVPSSPSGLPADDDKANQDLEAAWKEATASEK